MHAHTPARTATLASFDCPPSNRPSSDLVSPDVRGEKPAVCRAEAPASDPTAIAAGASTQPRTLAQTGFAGGDLFGKGG
jgi:hypothetical protein